MDDSSPVPFFCALVVSVQFRPVVCFAVCLLSELFPQRSVAWFSSNLQKKGNKTTCFGCAAQCRAARIAVVIVARFTVSEKKKKKLSHIW